MNQDEHHARRPLTSTLAERVALGERPNILGCSRAELEALAKDWGEPEYRGRQIFAGVFCQRATDFCHLSSLSKGLRARLAEAFIIEQPTIDRVQVSTDGTRKYRFVAADGAACESVYIPVVASGSMTNTLCVSSQTGCSVGCKFCFTASIKRARNLSSAEIVGQVMTVQDQVRELGEQARVTNIVFMGMGEPLLNYQQVVGACRTLLHDEGLDFSTRRVTISTSGIVPRIYDLGRDLATQLAISLNATTNEVRDWVMPINKKWPIEDLLAALRAYPLPRRRRFTIEYVLLGGVNDSIDDAQRLPKLLAGLPVKVNLLPLNAHERTELSPPDPDQVQRFQAELFRAGISAIIRTPRGRDIDAACGQLGDSRAAREP